MDGNPTQNNDQEMGSRADVVVIEAAIAWFFPPNVGMCTVITGRPALVHRLDVMAKLIVLLILFVFFCHSCPTAAEPSAGALRGPSPDASSSSSESSGEASKPAPAKKVVPSTTGCDAKPPCHADAENIDSQRHPRGYVCQCKPGFSGDGFVCCLLAFPKFIRYFCD